MMIFAYTYDADVHCVDCTQKVMFPLPVGLAASEVEYDEHGVAVESMDSEGNPVHPVFSTDEQLEPLFCGDCGEEIE